MNGPNKFTYFGIYKNKNVHLQNRVSCEFPVTKGLYETPHVQIDDILSQMTPLERKIVMDF